MVNRCRVSHNCIIIESEPDLLGLDGLEYPFEQNVLPHDIWRDSLGRDVAWSTEILSFEDDMMGTQESPCVFTHMRYLTNGSGDIWDVVNLGNSNWLLFSNDYSQWWVEPVMHFPDDSVLIWDVNPR